MQNLIAAFLLCAACGAVAADAEPPADASAPASSSAPTPASVPAAEPSPWSRSAAGPVARPTVESADIPVADQAALETGPFEGPRFGKSRVERRREKCQAQGREQGLKGAALDAHLRSCVKR